MNGLARWFLLATFVASALLVIGFGVQAAALAPYLGSPDVDKVPALDPSVASALNLISIAYGILFAVGLLAIAPAARAGTFGALGASISFVGNLLLATRYAWTSFVPGTPLPFHPLLPPAVIGAGALIFGIAVFRANVLSRTGALLLAVFCPTGLYGLAGPAATTLLFGTDLGLAPSTLLRMYGYLAMFVVATSWSLLALSVWRKLPDHELVPRPTVA